MRQISKTSELTIFKDISELDNGARALMQAAFEARDKAYAPYSNFNVGAAILLENGEIVSGSNQENASYPSGLCAERTAIYYAGAKYPKVKIRVLAISASSNNKETVKPIPPCGACRQAILEYELEQKEPIEIYFMGKSGEVAKSDSIVNLLPFIFSKDEL